MALVFASADAATPMAATLRVTVDGLTGTGPLRVGLYDEPTFSLPNAMPLKTQEVAKPAGTATVTFTGLPPGAYAIKAFQDANNDGRAEEGEPQGVSNGAKLGDFDAAAIVIAPGANTALIHLH